MFVADDRTIRPMSHLVLGSNLHLFVSGEGRVLFDAKYWNHGDSATSVVVSFDENSEGLFYAFAAYIGAVVGPPVTRQEAAEHVARYGGKLLEAEARGLLGHYANVLDRLAYRD